jgi:hypothetical protein
MPYAPFSQNPHGLFLCRGFEAIGFYQQHHPAFPPVLMTLYTSNNILINEYAPPVTALSYGHRRHKDTQKNSDL